VSWCAEPPMLSLKVYICTNIVFKCSGHWWMR
jgi:hypothetical protein